MSPRKLRIHIVMEGDARTHLVTTGRLDGDRSRISYDTFDDAYVWMRDRMLERLPGTAPEKPWPLWGWRRKRGRCKPRPSSYRLDVDHWIVSFDIPEDQVVLSRFDEWHYVLNCWYLPDMSVEDGGEAEDEALWAEMTAKGIGFHDRPYPEPYMSKIRNSWNAVFDIGDAPDVQATFWGVDRDMVVAETFIPARPRKSDIS
jgi:hypothetical protein